LVLSLAFDSSKWQSIEDINQTTFRSVSTYSTREDCSALRTLRDPESRDAELPHESTTSSNRGQPTIKRVFYKERFDYRGVTMENILLCDFELDTSRLRVHQCYEELM